MHLVEFVNLFYGRNILDTTVKENKIWKKDERGEID